MLRSGLTILIKIIRWLVLALLFSPITILSQTESLIFEENFNTNVLPEWEIILDANGSSDWFIDSGYLVQTSNIGDRNGFVGTTLLKKELELSDFVLRCSMYSTDDDYIGIVFRYKDQNNYYRFILSSQRKIILLQKKVNGVFYNLDSYTESEWPYVGFVTTISAKGNALKVYLNDKLFLESEDDTFISGSFGFMSCYNNGNFFDWIKIYNSYQIPPENTDLIINRGPYIQNLTDSSVVILWGTNKESNGVVQIGLDSTSYQTFPKKNKTRNHQLHINELDSNKKYFYRVVSEEVYSGWKFFKTFKTASDSFSFLVYGDTQNNFIRHKEIVSHFSEHEFDFIAHCGDVVQRGIRDDWEVEFFGPLEKYLSEKPVFVSIGNHQLNSENFYTYFEMPDRNHENYFSFSRGNSFFVFLDNRSAAYPDITYYPSIKKESPQYIWLEEQLSSFDAQEADWIFVFSHIPAYLNFSLNAYPDNTDYLIPLFEEYNVDFNFSGHIHGYERGFRNNTNYVTTAGGGGIGPVKDDGFSDPPYQLTNYPFREIYNFCIVQVKGTSINYSAYDIFGNKFDSKNCEAIISSVNGNSNAAIKNGDFSSYPNPFNDEVIFEYILEKSSYTSIKLYNVLGKQIASLINDFQPKGKYIERCDMSKISSGVLFARLITKDTNKTIKILHVK